MELSSRVFTLTDHPVENENSGRQLLTAFPPGAKIDVVLFEVTTQTKTIGDVSYRVVNSYISTNFDASKGYFIRMVYDTPQQGDEVLCEPLEEVRNYTINGSVPKYRGTGEDMPYVYKSVLYIPASYTLVMCHAYITDGEDKEYRGVVYKKAREVRLSEYIATYSSDFVETNVNATNPYSAIIRIDQPSDAETERERLAFAVNNSLKKSGEESQTVSGALKVTGSLSGEKVRTPSAADIEFGGESKSENEDSNLQTELDKKRDKTDFSIPPKWIVTIPAGSTYTDPSKFSVEFDLENPETYASLNYDGEEIGRSYGEPSTATRIIFRNGPHGYTIDGLDYDCNLVDDRIAKITEVNAAADEAVERAKNGTVRSFASVGGVTPTVTAGIANLINLFGLSNTRYALDFLRASSTNNTSAKTYIENLIASKYTKPAGGIPASDLATDEKMQTVFDELARMDAFTSTSTESDAFDVAITKLSELLGEDVSELAA